MNLKRIVLIAIVVVALIFIIQNTETVSVVFLFFEVSMPRAILITACILIGIIIGVLLPYRVRKQNIIEKE
jgi:putative membrane protein